VRISQFVVQNRFEQSKVIQHKNNEVIFVRPGKQTALLAGRKRTAECEIFSKKFP